MSAPCENMKNLIADFVLGNLDQQQSDALTAHIAKCAPCAEYLKALETQKARLNQLSETIDAEMTARIDRAIEALNRSAIEQKMNTISIWRTIMKNRITKLAIAACILIAAILIIHRLGVSLDGTTTAYAQITFEQIKEATKRVTWMHQVSTGFERGVSGRGEQWVGFETKIWAAKPALGPVMYFDIANKRKSIYTPDTNTVTISELGANEFPLDLTDPNSLLDSLTRMALEQGAQLTYRYGEYNRHKVQIQDAVLAISATGERHTLTLYVDDKTHLLLGAAVKGADSSGNVIMDGTVQFTYPQEGPGDIYALGVPRTATVNDMTARH